MRRVKLFQTKYFFKLFKSTKQKTKDRAKLYRTYQVDCNTLFKVVFVHRACIIHH